MTKQTAGERHATFNALLENGIERSRDANDFVIARFVCVPCAMAFAWGESTAAYNRGMRHLQDEHKMKP